MKLTPYQIEQITVYIDDQNIWYDDVKAEIIDHVATAVEEKMASEELAFIEASAEVFLALNINRFQRHKLNYEHLATLREVGNEMLTFLKGKRLLYMIAIISVSGLGFSISTTATEWLFALGIGLPALPGIYFLVILNYPRKHPIRYQSYYVSKVHAINLPICMILPMALWAEDWLLAHPIIAVTFFSAYPLFVVAGLMVINKNLKQVKSNVALH